MGANTDHLSTLINRQPILTREQEHEIAVRLRDAPTRKDRDTLVNANLRFVLMVAHKYRGYGLSLEELFQEGCAGLIEAVDKYDPTKEARLLSYASVWIRRAIRLAIARNWSLVSVSSGRTTKRLFWQLRKQLAISAKESGRERADISDEELARLCDAPVEVVTSLRERIESSDTSLVEWSDSAADHALTAEGELLERDRQDRIRAALQWAAGSPKQGDLFLDLVAERYRALRALIDEEPAAVLAEAIDRTAHEARKLQFEIVRDALEGIGDAA
jgi:RNA polymerase sigma-32 factor